MTLEQAKQLLIRKYRYLYENAYFILAPFMHEQTQEEYEESKRIGDFEAPLIYLEISVFDKINTIFEDFLLSEKNIEDTILYQLVENNRDNREYLEKVKKGIKLLEEKKDNIQESLDVWRILTQTYDYVTEQSGDLKNKRKKLKVLDEYCKIARYRNNGKIYTSGRNLNLHDCESLAGGQVFYLPGLAKDQQVPFREKKDIGITKNSFITSIASAPHYEDNWSIFTESEKQKIYLDYHDELPCDLEITCGLEEEYSKTMAETRLYRPENTNPCRKRFIVKENEIFIRPNDCLYKYFQLCPHCGYIVNIPKEILSDGIQKRIEERCSKDEKLFRKMFLYSELFSLDKASTKEQKKLLKK